MIPMKCPLASSLSAKHHSLSSDFVCIIDIILCLDQLIMVTIIEHQRLTLNVIFLCFSVSSVSGWVGLCPPKLHFQESIGLVTGWWLVTGQPAALLLKWPSLPPPPPLLTPSIKYPCHVTLHNTATDLWWS